MNNKNIIKTSHELNHFKGGYTRLELDFIYAFISTIKDEDERFKDYSISLSEMENKLGKRLELSKINYIFDSLITKSFKIDNNEKLAVYSFFTYLEFDKNQKILTVNFNEKLKPHLIQLNTYAKGNFKYLLQFKSEYSKRIYMLLSQWKNIEKKIYSVEDLRTILSVPTKYLYAEFKRTVIKKAEAELLKNSDIFFTFKEIKQGRKVTDIVFHIYVSGGRDKTLKEPKYDDYKKKKVYFNGANWIILNITTCSKSKGYVDVQLLDEDMNTRMENINFSSLKNMVEYIEKVHLNC